MYFYVSVVLLWVFLQVEKLFFLSNFSEVLETAMQNYIVNMYVELLELFCGHIKIIYIILQCPADPVNSLCSVTDAKD